MRRWILLGLLALLLMTPGCATIAERLEDDLAEGENLYVLNRAERWLQQEAEGAPASLRRQVEVLRARAKLELLKEEDSIQAYKTFRDGLKNAAHLRPVAREALEFESRAWFRKNVLTNASVSSCALFRQRYPESSLLAESRRVESERAYQQALGSGDIDGHRAFRATYGDWPEAAPVIEASLRDELALAFGEATATGTRQAVSEFRLTYEDWPDASAIIAQARALEFRLALSEAREAPSAAAFKQLRLEYGDWPEAEGQRQALRDQEARLTFEEAMALDGAGGLRAFRHHYGDWPEAQPFLDRAYQAELTRALQTATDSGDPEALVDFRQQYPDEPDWQAKAWAAEARMVVGVVLAVVASRRTMEPPEVDAWVARNAALPPVQAEARPHEEAIWRWAQQTAHSTSYRLFGALYPESRHIDQARTREWELAWIEAEAAGRMGAQHREALLEFVARYPDHPRALQAERRHYNMARIDRAQGGSQRATITAARPTSGNTVELYVDVRDCLGERVSGLKGQDFEVFVDGDAVALRDFAGLEEARPVDIVFEIDLSGSMTTEIEAVQEAVIRFAEVFRFRHRRTRLGLVTFSDELRKTIPLTANITQFQRSVASLGELMGGGSGEDSTHALLKGAQLLGGSNAERVSILLSDEPLQINLGGRQALGGQGTAECARARKVAACLQRCTRSNPACVTGCMMALNAATRRSIQACVRRYGHRRCAWAISGRGLINSLNRCSTPVSEYSDEMDRLASRLDRAQVRPYLLVPEGLSGFAALAERTQGQLIPVPEDDPDPTPYVEALMEIADQLSRQYVLTLPADAVKPGARVDVLARSGHIWIERAALPSQGALGLFPVPGHSPDCPEFLLVTATEGVFISDQCAASWTRVGAEQLTEALTAATPHLGGVMTLDVQGRVHEISLPDAQVATLEQLHAARLAPGPDEEALLVRRDAPDAPWSLTPLPPGQPLLTLSAPQAEAPIPLLHPEGGPPCLLVSHDRMTCARDGQLADVPIQGLPADLLAQPARVLPVPGRPGVFLATTGQGAVLRSIDGGQRWHPMIAPDGHPRDLVFIDGAPPVACTTSTRNTLCSDDSGLSWFQVGRDFDAEDRSAMAWDGQQLFVAQGGQLQRLDRVINREIPSTSVYFTTNARTPAASMFPFLQDIADTMASNPALVLRVEGHADHRGSADYNEALASDRAKSIIAYIQAQGIDPSRLQAVSYGERRPVSTRQDTNAMALNRRVELILLRPEIHLTHTPDPCQ